VITELFSLGVTAEVIQVNIDWKSAFLKEWDQCGPKFQIQGVVNQETFFLSEN